MNKPLAEGIITEFWGTLAEAKKAFPLDRTIETVSGTAHATSHERGELRGYPCIVVRGYVTRDLDV